MFPNILIAAAFLLPGVSRAAFLLDTGTPAGSGAPLVVSSAQSLAGEFSATAGETITQLAAYLSPGTGSGNSLVFDLYSGTFIGSHATKTLVDGTIATFTGTGWTSANVNWVVPTTGNYWFVVGPNGSSTALDAPTETSASTGTAPALGFAFSNSGGSFTSTSSGFGLEVSGIVPEPATYGLFAGLGLCVVSLGSQFRRKTV